MSRSRPRDVAIVGMGCRFPGAPDLVTFWENILAAKSAIGDVPPDLRPADVFGAPNPPADDRVIGRRGGYLDFPIALAPAAHGAIPGAVDGGEPEQHLILDAARAALSDAGLSEGDAARLRVEVIIGRSNDFHRGNLARLQHGRIVEQMIAVARALRPDLTAEDLEALRIDLKAGLPPFDASAISEQLTDSTAGLVATRLGPRGAGLVVDAAGASSLVALDLGARALIEGRADLALVGGVYVHSDIDFPTVFSRLGARSRSGVARPFARNADGMVPGEGAGVVLLKILERAERDGDRVYATLKAVGLSSDGTGVPSARGQALAMRRAYRRSGLDPASVGLLEGQGLGVAAADRAELRAIRAVFPQSNDRALGAVSSMIGHAMSASGIAGLIKTALALHHRVLPPTLGVEAPHPLLNGEDRPATPNRATRPWVHGGRGTPRRAGVNAFGSSGTSAHAILEEHAASARRPGALLRWETEVILLDAPDRSSLIARANALADRLEVRPDVALKDLAATLNDRIGIGPARLGLVVGSTADLLRRLRDLVPRLASPDCRSIRDLRGTYFREREGTPEPLAVIFPGEGSQFPGMLGELAMHFPSVLALLDTSDRLARESGATDLPSRLLYGDGAAEGNGLWAIGPAVNVVLSAQWALYGLLRELGIRPGAVVGHSSGEFLALAACGAVRVDRHFEDALGGLGALFERLDASGAVPEAGLLAVAAGRERVESLASGLGVVVAMDNCPHQVVVAGPDEAIRPFAERLKAEGVLWEVLPFARGYHTAGFAPAVAPVRRLLDDLDVQSPEIPIYSCASAGRMPTNPDGMRDLSASQWSRPVRFREAIERMYGDGFRTFVDVGPRGHLAGFVDDILRGRPANSLAMGLPRRSGTTQLNHLVANLFSLGHAPRTAMLYERRRPQTIDLDAPPPATFVAHTLRPGFPEMRVSEAMAERLRKRSPAIAPDASGPRSVPPGTGDAGDAMLDHLRTMDQFLATQRDVMAAYLRPAATPPEPGPWAGEIREFEPGRRVVTAYVLHAAGDPVAAHHTLGGRRVSAVDPGRLGLPVLPFAVMAEMLAQAAAILHPGSSLVALRDVVAHRWIRYEEEPITLEIEAWDDETRPGEVRVAIFNRGPARAMKPRESAAVEGVAAFAANRPDAFMASPFSLPDPTPSRFTAERLYGEQWLFHGPALQAVTRVGSVSDAGIEGTLRVLPRGPLLREPDRADRLLTDPIILDNFTHLLGTWGLDRLDGGDVVFPLRMGELALFGTSPEDGTGVECRIRVIAREHHRLRAEAEVVRPDGTLWMRIMGWEDWRFHWPSRYRDVFRRPDVELLAEPLSLGFDTESTRVSWLEPPADMGRPVWRDVLEQIQLSPRERELTARGPEERRSLRLWGRIAAKDAARQLLLARHAAPMFPADLEILPDASGKPILRSLAHPGRHDLPTVSIAHTSGVAVAMATLDAEGRPGIDVERVVARSRDFEAIAFLPAERRLLDLAAREGDRDEWIARFWCAKEAAAKAAGLGLVDGPRGAQVVGLGPGAGTLLVGLSGALDAMIPGTSHAPIGVATSRRGDYVLAWTLGERSTPP